MGTCFQGRPHCQTPVVWEDRGEVEGGSGKYEEGFQAGYNEGRRDEYEDWSSDGHGTHCSHQATIPYDDYGTQPDSASTPSTIIENGATSTSTAITSTQTEMGTSQYLEMGSPTHTATSHPQMLSGNSRKNLKIDSTSEIPQYTAVFPSPTLSATVSNQSASFTAITVLETRPTMANFNQKPEKLEKPPFSNQITSKTPTPSVSEPTDDIARVYASPHTQSDIVLQPQSAPATHSNASSSELPAATGHEKSTIASVIFESQTPMVSPAPTSIVTALETRSESVDSMKIHQKTENSPTFTQKVMEPFVSDNYKCADDTYTPPALATIIQDFKTHSEKSSFTENDRNVEKSAILTHFSWADDSEPLHSPFIISEPILITSSSLQQLQKHTAYFLFSVSTLLST